MQQARTARKDRLSLRRARACTWTTARACFLYLERKLVQQKHRQARHLSHRRGRVSPVSTTNNQVGTEGLLETVTSSGPFAFIEVYSKTGLVEGFAILARCLLSARN